MTFQTFRGRWERGKQIGKVRAQFMACNQAARGALDRNEMLRWDGIVPQPVVDMACLHPQSPRQGALASQDLDGFC